MIHLFWLDINHTHVKTLFLRDHSPHHARLREMNFCLTILQSGTLNLSLRKLIMSFSFLYLLCCCISSFVFLFPVLWECHDIADILLMLGIKHQSINQSIVVRIFCSRHMILMTLIIFTDLKAQQKINQGKCPFLKPKCYYVLFILRPFTHLRLSF